MSVKRKLGELANNINQDTLVANEYFNYDLMDKTPRDRNALRKTMERGCKVLDELGVTYWLARGSLLGLHRDNDLLTTDIDIDIDLLGDKDIYRIIQRLPFEPLFMTLCHGRHQQCAFIDPETNVVFDIWIFYENNSGIIVNRNYYGYFWLPEILKDNIVRHHFKGREYPLPNPDWYCEFWYGENWRTPMKYSEDWSVYYQTTCKGFVYTGTQNLVVNNHY